MGPRRAGGGDREARHGLAADSGARELEPPLRFRRSGAGVPARVCRRGGAHVRAGERTPRGWASDGRFLRACRAATRALFHLRVGSTIDQATVTEPRRAWAVYERLLGLRGWTSERMPSVSAREGRQDEA